MSLEGLSSLIQLESTRLEGAKQTNQNSQSINNTVQQQGTQVAQSRLNSTLGRINAQYDKEVAQADVRKLEKKLSRARASEALSLQIAAFATVSNAIGNFGHLVNDLKGRQKLGETPDYLKAPPITSQPQLSITQPKEGLGATAYISGTNKDGTETIYSYQTSPNDGVSVGELPLSANISEYDKERILGADYASMKASNGGQPLSFSEIHAQRPDLADKLITTKGHGVSSTEAEDLMRVAKVAIPPGGSTFQSGSRNQTTASQDAVRLGAIKQVTDPNNTSAEQLARISDITSGFNEVEKHKFFNNKDISNEDMDAQVRSNPGIRTQLFADPAFKEKMESNVQSFPNGEVYLVTKNQDGKEDVQYNDNGIAFEVNNISTKDKEGILGKKYENMSFSEILAQKPDGASLARKLIAGRLERDFNKLEPNKKVEYNYNNMTPEQKGALKSTNPDLFNGDKFDSSKITSDQEKKLKASHPELFQAPSPTQILGYLQSNPDKANELVTQASGASGSSIKPLDASQATQNANRAGALNNLHTSTFSLKDNLVQSGKLSNDTTLDKVGNVAKNVTNFLVTTAQQSAPYFQAYLKAKERADEIYDALIAAKDKLNAASNKLKAIEMQIDAFSGRGA